MSQPGTMSFFLEGPRFTWRESHKDSATGKRVNQTRNGQLPVPKNKKQARIVRGKVGTKPFPQIFDAQRVIKAQEALERALALLRPDQPYQAVRLDVAFVFVPPRAPQWRYDAALAGFVQCDGAGTGDRDNLHKLLADALQNTGWIANDSQITQGDVRKEWGPVRGYRLRFVPLQSVASFAEWKEVQGE